MRRILVAATLPLLASLLALLLPLAGAGAQLAELQPGTRVRLRAPSAVAGCLEGTVVTRVADTVTVTRPNAAPVPIPLAAITSVEVSRGKSRSAGAVRGALWGGGVGLVLGVLAAAAPNECTGDCEDEPTDTEMVVATPIVSALIGAPVGAIVGAERWVRLSIPGRAPRVPGRSGQLRVALSIRF